ncbi:MAG TPA: FAD:protein FMN transferase [Sedimentisphaerales bacterium]|nr:FAD:protein FMN transferase [Sedimentisphaerales bacterium]
MKQPEPETCFVRSDCQSIPGMKRFCHEAMATTFEVIIEHEDARYARQAAAAAFDEVDWLEGELSRFIENSDITRINNLPANEPLRLGLDAFECLQLSSRIYTETNGAFDITIGSLFSCWRNEDGTPRTPSQEELNLARQRTGTDLLQLDEAEHTVQLLASPVQVDLGGVGKGYAVDRVAELLCEWSIETALISGGYSSVLALDAPCDTKGWPLTLSNPDNRKQILARPSLRGRAISGSGLQKGRHIIDPRTAQPVKGKCAAWASAPDAATADALSTAFMVMSPDEIRQYCSRHPDVSALIMLESQDKDAQKKEILRFGRLKDDELLQ